MELIFNNVTAVVMFLAILGGIAAFPVVFIRSGYELVAKRSKPMSWYFKVWLIPLGFLFIGGVMFVGRSLSPLFWGKPTGGSFVLEKKFEVNGQTVHSERNSADVTIRIPKEGSQK